MFQQNFYQHRPCSDPNSQSPISPIEQNIGSRIQQSLQVFPQTLSSASSSTLAVNNGLVGNPTPVSTPKIERKSKRISNIFVSCKFMKTKIYF
jgi:hypothetical protein